METSNRSRVVVCDTQPVTIEGVRAILDKTTDLTLAGSSPALARASEIEALLRPDVLLVDKTFGTQPLIEFLQMRQQDGAAAPVAIWGNSMTEAEALRFLQTGARGIVRRIASADLVVTCLRSVAGGNTWMEENLFGDALRQARGLRSELTGREAQVLQLVEQGMRNREIARELGIQPGTVKIHLKHIFEKTGVRGRYGLALNSLKDRDLLTREEGESDRAETDDADDSQELMASAVFSG